MIRVLHLIDHPADYQTAQMVNALKADASGALDVRSKSIGRGGDFALPFFAFAALRRSPGLTGDVIHAWGPIALRIAAFAGRTPIVYSPSSDPTRHEIGWARSAMSHRNLQIVCPTDTIRRTFVERGVPIERCHLIRPGVAFAKIRRRRNEALRAELGFRSDDRVTLAAGESTQQSQHQDAVYALTLLNALDPHNRLLVWGRGSHAPAVRRFAHKLTQSKLDHPLFVDAQRKLRRPIDYAELFGVADEILITANRPVPTYAICLSMAAALPIVSTVTPTIAELLEDRHTALFVTKSSPRLIAQRVLHLRADTNLQWAIADMARTEAYEFFSMSRFLEQHRVLYQQVAEGKSVQLPAIAPGAGLRFHGRA